jgi:hypothetical protein
MISRSDNLVNRGAKERSKAFKNFYVNGQARRSARQWRSKGAMQ